MDEWSDQPLVPAQFLTFGKGLMHWQSRTARRHLVRPVIVDWFLPLWATSPFEDLQAPMVLTGTLRRVAPLSVPYTLS